MRNYTDPHILDRELASVFTDHPLVAGHVSNVPEPGSYLLSDWNRIPYVVTRDRQGRLRAFLNQCRHRGARLVKGDEKQLKAFVCPFHNWVYDLDGSLRAITRQEDFPGVDAAEYGLKELPVAEAGGLIWIHPDPDGTLDLRSYLGRMLDDLVEFDIEKLVRYRKTKVVKNANWKLLIKTYLEGYHVPYLHRTTLSKAFRKGVLAHFEDGPHIRMSAARSNIDEILETDPESWRILDYASVYYVLFPNTFFIMHPDYVSINIFYPLAPDRTIWTHEMLYRKDDFPGEEGEAALAKRFDFTNDVVFDGEDFAVAEDVQENLRYGANDFHTLGLAEGLLAMFQQSIDDRLR
ncbi:aromatic ring-hydroxylating oxygenase subunit alpha [Micromonospora echinofusca]|uniref:aromatic ring-hydroxylating oxygenase subunit alpha n=1 Tax=Micromonospora echinofusca TaxID=47858 RepID=UPI001AD7E0B8|nr:aromatic ring-hydroxylating dioxygenase subunit alpha [Micromonospora echinofusca]